MAAPAPSWRASSSFCSSSHTGTFTSRLLSCKQGLQYTNQHSNLLSMKTKTSCWERQRGRPKQRLHVYAEYNNRKGTGAGDFFAGFVLGGVVFGALGYLFAPQVGKFISAVEKEFDDPSRRLPKGFDDDEGLEKTRRNLNEKIAQLNAAIDDVSAQLRADDRYGGEAGGDTTELESAT